MSLNDVVQYYVARHIIESRSHLWLYPSPYGSFARVLDRGLAGWWGDWWHQTFRLQFSAPAIFLRRHGYTAKGTILGAVVTMLITFAQSGILHACGSLSATPPTKPWRAPVFFVLQAAGILLQFAMSGAFRALWPGSALPETMRKAARLAFALLWLHITSPVFVDDLASTGLWLTEPVPISLFRWLGFGHKGNHWLRWTTDMWPCWYQDDKWWKSGLGL
jgi:hypothetical protein